MKCPNCGRNNFSWATTCSKCDQSVTAQTGTTIPTPDGCFLLPLARIEPLVHPGTYRVIREAFPDGMPLNRHSFELLHAKYQTNANDLLIDLLPEEYQAQVATTALNKALSYLVAILEKEGAHNDSLALRNGLPLVDLNAQATRDAVRKAHRCMENLENDERSRWMETEPRGPRDKLDRLHNISHSIKIWAMDAFDKTGSERASQFFTFENCLAQSCGRHNSDVYAEQVAVLLRANPTKGLEELMAESNANQLIQKVLRGESTPPKDHLRTDLEQLRSGGDQWVTSIEEAVRSCAVGGFAGLRWWENAPLLCGVLATIGTPAARKALVTIINTDSAIVEFDQVRATAAKLLGTLRTMAAELIPELEAASKCAHAPTLALYEAIEALGGVTEATPAVIIEQGRNKQPREAIEYFALYQERANRWTNDQKRYFFSSFGAKVFAAFFYSSDERNRPHAKNAAAPYFAAALLADPDPHTSAWSHFEPVAKSPETPLCQ